MKLFMPIFVGVIAVAAFVAVGIGIQRTVTAETAQVYTCSPTGLFVAPTTGPALLDSSDRSKIALATNWLKTMTKTRTETVTDSVISSDSDYAPSYQGAMSGTFTLEGRTFESDASIEVTSPATVADSYRGVVSGRVLETPTASRWIIQAYKRVDGVISQVAVQALADGTTGNFSIDLTAIDPGIEGEWMFGLLDAENGYAPYGQKWPDANYVGLEVQQYIITDTLYYWATAAARTDGTFSFPGSNTGSKLFRLVDTTTDPDDILAEYTKPTGLVRSYEYEVGETGYGTALEDRSFVYDQAVALFAAIGLGDDSLAKLLVGGLLQLQTTSGPHLGGFFFAGPQLSPTYTDMLYRTGAHAIATDALLAYIQSYPEDTDNTAYKTAAKNALDFMQTTYSSTSATSGLYLGGYGLYSGSPQTFDADYVIEWASTEHNIDAWHALVRASKVLGDDDVDYSARASDLNTAISIKLYNTEQQRFNQGVNDSSPDTADPLDTNSWGAIQLYASGNKSAAQLAKDRLSLFAYTDQGIDGYGPFYDAGGYPGATPTVWYEGSFGVALTYYRLGDYNAYRTLIDKLTAGQEVDGSFRYATSADTTYDIGVSRSVASTAWYILATAGRDTIWNSCVYVAPASTEEPDTTPSSSGNSAGPTAQIPKPLPRDESELPTTATVNPDGTVVPTSPTDISDVDTSESDNSDSQSDDQPALGDAKATPVPMLIAGAVTVVVAGGLVTWFIRRRL